ncbi:MAG: peptidoglycan peptidase [Deltaproteobacteria bacterium]|jgi:hypothetical protein|nr:peptidoglycan peptidase [Deltaproteobacteria bacterium]
MKLGRILRPIGLVAGTLALASLLAFGSKAHAYDFHEGDILLQSISTTQSLALAMATGSDYTHCGIVFKRNGQVFVYEAQGVMVFTPIIDFIGKSSQPILLLRLKDPSVLTPEVVKKMKDVARSFELKQYDYRFRWSDEFIYCSELVYKIYQRGAGIDLVPLKRFRDYNLDHPAVKALIERRYGDSPPLDELAVSPADLINSPLLELVTKVRGAVIEAPKKR